MPFLGAVAVLLGVLFASLIIQRVVRERIWRRRQALDARYQPLIDAITQNGLTEDSLRRLQRVRPFHHRILSRLLLAPLHAARGEVTSHVRDAARSIGLIDDWKAGLNDGRWWLRADSVRALGFIEEPSALPAVLAALDDGHREVRAAAVEAAGRLGDPRAIAPLVGRLADGGRYQRARVVDALRGLGSEVTPALVALALARRDQARLVLETLGLIGTASAIDPVLQWCDDPRDDVRAAALAALGSLGLDDRGFYFALRALSDSDATVRSMAARALGRSSREDAVGYLAACLDDEWMPAAQAAGALRRLGEPGRAALRVRADDPGQAGDLARQMLWAQ